jgi:hypothetical protein
MLQLKWVSSRHMHGDLKIYLYLSELHSLGYIEEFHPDSIIPAEVGAILNIQIPMAVLNLCMECLSIYAVNKSTSMHMGYYVSHIDAT